MANQHCPAESPARVAVVQMESMNVKIYKQLQLSRDQKEHLRDFWDAWEHRKRSIDSTMQTARAKLRNLPYGVSLPLPFLNLLSSLAGAAPAHPMRGWELDVDACEFEKVCLLGISPVQTELAAACLRELRAVHAADIAAFVDFKEVQLLPVSTLQTRQMVCMWSAHVLHKAAPHDFFGLARLASMQLQRESLYRLQTYAS